jgi:hypothetical protein
MHARLNEEFHKKQAVAFGITLILLFTGIALATSSASSDVILYAFDQNPAGSDDGNEWVTFHNPTNKSVDVGNWTFESTHGTTAIDWIAEGTTLYPGAYCTYTPHYLFPVHIFVLRTRLLPIPLISLRS